MNGRLSADVEDYVESGVALDPDRAGYIRVVVDPWAEVYVDGQKVATTPTARAIPLPPGRHFIKLSNPYYDDVDRELRIRTGETEVIDVTLEPLVPVEDEQAPDTTTAELREDG
jgi:serine/threonine-protein kinase